MNDPKRPHPFPRDRSFMPGRPGGEAWDDDSVEGHAMAGIRGKFPRSSDDDQDTEGHKVLREEEDTEGHAALRSQLRAGEGEDEDTEGHAALRGQLRADEGEDEDTEGHAKHLK
jgi:hypothetical protein